MNESNEIVYVAGKEPLTQHPQKCRIGVCRNAPALDDGWSLFSLMKGEDADKIYSEVMGCLNDAKATNYDVATEAWLIPLGVLDKWMTSSAELLRLRNPSHSEMMYFRIG